MDGFISYAHDDWALVKTLKPTFDSIRLSGGPSFWNDQALVGGDKWESKVLDAISRATYFVFLMSGNAIVSEFILTKEWPAMVEREERHGALIVPVLLKNCLWKSRPEFSWRQVIPLHRAKPHPISKWTDRDTGVTEMGEQLLKSIADYKKYRAS